MCSYVRITFSPGFFLSLSLCVCMVKKQRYAQRYSHFKKKEKITCVEANEACRVGLIREKKKWFALAFISGPSSRVFFFIPSALTFGILLLVSGSSYYYSKDCRRVPVPGFTGSDYISRGSSTTKSHRPHHVALVLFFALIATEGVRTREVVTSCPSNGCLLQQESRLERALRLH